VGRKKRVKIAACLVSAAGFYICIFYVDIQKGKNLRKFQKWELYGIVFVFFSESNFIIKALLLK